MGQKKLNQKSSDKNVTLDTELNSVTALEKLGTLTPVFFEGDRQSLGFHLNSIKEVMAVEAF